MNGNRNKFHGLYKKKTPSSTTIKSCIRTNKWYERWTTAKGMMVKPQPTTNELTAEKDEMAIS